ncbi:UNVERIFIED_CONTAM: hypothetical protein HDU68_001636 [Siphonaria sp. JEL0065]|nr:hypothetical protein HDU68_001636 [Siphonaria sp. JEL0065]
MSSQAAKLKKVGTMNATVLEASQRGFGTADAVRSSKEKAKETLKSKPKKGKKRPIAAVIEAEEEAEAAEEVAETQEDDVVEEAVDQVEDHEEESQDDQEETQAIQEDGEEEQDDEEADEEAEEDEIEAPPAKKAKLVKAGTMATTVKEAKERGFAAADNAGERATKTAAKASLVTPAKTKKGKKVVIVAPTPKTKLTKAGTMATTVKEAKERGFAAADDAGERATKTAAKASLITPPKTFKARRAEARKAKLARKGTMAATLEDAAALGITPDLPLGSRRQEDDE